MFLHPYLLAGLAACAVPVLLHLLMQRKPRPLVFPAVRFLLQRRSTNQRRMQLRNVALMLLRVAVLAALILALARPRLFASAAASLTGKDARVVLLVDTSPSMEYDVAGVSRLEEAVTRGKELLDALGSDSRVAVLDSGELGDEPFLSLADARARLSRLRIRYSAGSLNRAAERGLDLLARERRPEGPALAMFLLTDRARAAWDQRGTIPKRPDDVAVRVIDVGASSPRALGIESAEVVPPVVAPGREYQVRVRVRGTPTGHEASIACKLDIEEDARADRKPVKLERGQDTEVLVFTGRQAPEGRAAADTPFGLRVWVEARGRMPFFDARHATLVVRGRRRMLCLTGPDGQGGDWPRAIAALRAFTAEVKTFAEAGKDDLAPYACVAVCQPEEVPAGWWDRLAEYVKNGGGLAVIPGEGATPRAFNAAGDGVLPALLDVPEDASEARPARWEKFQGAHPLMAPFVKWARAGADFSRPEYWPFARRFWRLGPLQAGATAIASYDLPGRPPALLERRVGKGRVVLFTTPLDRANIRGRDVQWTNFWQDNASFGLVLIDQVSKYLAGEQGSPRLAFPCGVEVSVPLPLPQTPPYTLRGPGLAAGERSVRAPAPGADAAIPQARLPGNYTVLDGRDQPVAGFSLDVSSREGDLTRIEASELEAVFGEGCVAEPGSGSLRDALSGGKAEPFELLPWLMMALLAVMTGEGLLANRYYGSPPEGEEKG
jgi:hypothetical protein